MILTHFLNSISPRWKGFDYWIRSNWHLIIASPILKRWGLILIPTPDMWIFLSKIGHHLGESLRNTGGISIHGMPVAELIIQVIWWHQKRQEDLGSWDWIARISKDRVSWSVWPYSARWLLRITEKRWSLGRIGVAIDRGRAECGKGCIYLLSYMIKLQYIKKISSKICPQ